MLEQPHIRIFSAAMQHAEKALHHTISTAAALATAAVKAGMPAIGFVGGGHASPALGERLLQAGALRLLRRLDGLPRLQSTAPTGG